MGEVQSIYSPVIHLAVKFTFLALLQSLSRRRNYHPVAETINVLLSATRAHAGFAMRPSGEQVLANVMGLAELAREYESSGGTSFRGFVEQLLGDAERGKQAEAAIYEEGADGVRLMSIHKAKGLEFPVVILADVTAKIAHWDPDRYLAPEKGLCAVKLAGWAPIQRHLADQWKVMAKVFPSWE
jgi:ATP-dependent helicase/nuclease subunit A